MMESSKPDKVRLTADLTLSEANALKDLASRQGITLTEALRRAIATEKSIQERRDEGNRILLEKNGTIRELLFIR